MIEVNTLSVVQIVPDTYIISARLIAARAGFGPDNLGIKLHDAQGVIYWGGHAWWKPSVFNAQTRIPAANEAAVDATGNAALKRSTLPTAITSMRDGGIPYEHWVDVLGKNCLTAVSQEA